MRRLSLLCAAALLAQASGLNDAQRRDVELQRRKAEAEYDLNKYDWISPLNLELSKRVSGSNGNETDTGQASVSISQDLFRSGGIYYAIRYAGRLYDSQLLSAQSAEAAKLKALYTALIEYRSLQRQIERQRLEVRNAEITLQIKRELFDIGATDITELNNAIISLNTLENAMFELEASRDKARQTLSTLSDDTPDSIELPTLTRLDKAAYDAARYDLRQSAYDLELSDLSYKVSRAAYLPALTFTGEYGRQEVEYDDASKSDMDGEYYAYGLSLSLPLHVTTGSDLERRRVETLQSRNDLQLLALESDAQYQSLESDLRRLERQIERYRRNIALYDELIESTRQSVELGDKTPLDLEMLQNSRDVERLKIEINDKSIQLKLVELHFAGV